MSNLLRAERVLIKAHLLLHIRRILLKYSTVEPSLGDRLLREVAEHSIERAEREV